jgi:hypothetical protein
MLQTVDGTEVFVVDLEALPELPITWNNAEEEPYAKALDHALRTGVITQPGKYGIELEVPKSRADYNSHYSIHLIKE